MNPSTRGEIDPPLISGFPEAQKEMDSELFYPRVIQIEAGNSDRGYLSDFDLLKRLLAIIDTKRDIERLAHRLIGIFGSFSRIVTAPDEELSAVDGVGKHTLILLKIVQYSVQHLIRSDLTNEPILNNEKALKNYLFARLSHELREKFLVLFLNRDGRLLADEILSSGTVDFVHVDQRELIKRILDLRATAVILVHNHPSGNAEPSQLDLDLTKEICVACSVVGIKVHEHYIVGNGVITRLKEDGYLRW